MNDADRITAPERLTGEWCDQQAARVLLGAETIIENGDRVTTYISLAEAWRDLAASVRGE